MERRLELQPPHTCSLTFPPARPPSLLQPHSDGLLVQLCVSPSAAKQLRGHPLLAALLPLATWVGSDTY